MEFGPFLKFCASNPTGPSDFYTPALLFEAGYIGFTFSPAVPEGAEKMREYAIAQQLFLETLPRDENGEASWQGISVSGAAFGASERAFIKAAGMLFLESERAKRRERLWSFSFGVLAAFVAFLFQSYLPQIVGLIASAFFGD